MTVKTQKIKQLEKSYICNDNQNIQELEKKLAELVLEDFSEQPSSVYQLFKDASYSTGIMCKKYFKLKLFSREAVQFLAIGAAVVGVTNTLQQPSNNVSMPLVADSLLLGSMNLLMYNSGFCYPQMIMINLLTYPLKSESHLFGNAGKLLGGVLGTFLGGGGFNVGINHQPIIVKLDPHTFKETIYEISSQLQFVVDKIEKAEENLVILSFDQAKITLKEAGGVVQVIVDNAIANTFKGTQLTIEAFGNVLKSRIDQGAQEAKLIINNIPFISNQASTSFVDGFSYSMMQSLWYSNFRYLKNDIQTSFLRHGEKLNLIGLIDFVWKQAVGAELSAHEKEKLYRELLLIINTNSNPPEYRDLLFLLIGYAAIHDSDLKSLSVSWLFFKTNHTKNIIGAIRDRSKGSKRDIATMLEVLDYNAMYEMFPAIKVIHETLLLPAIINLKTDIDEYFEQIKGKLKSNEQQQKKLFTAASITIASIALLFYNRNSQFLQTVKNKIPWLFTQEAAHIGALGITFLVITNVIQQQNSVNKDILRCIDELRKNNLNEQEQLKQEMHTEKKNTLLLKEELLSILNVQKEAISFLYDKMKDASKVSFDITIFEDIDGQQPPSDIQLNPPPGFQPEECKFFRTINGNFYYPQWGHWLGFSWSSSRDSFKFSDFINSIGTNLYKQSSAISGVLASKPVMSEQEIEQKKREYKLLV